MAPKRKIEIQQKNVKNPLLKLIPNVTFKIDEKTYNSHKEWDKLENDKKFMNIFEYWYNSNTQHYKHIKHAFNSMCKHYKLITIKSTTILLDKKNLTKLWSIQSYKETSDELGRTWLYQENDEEFNLVMYRDTNTFELKEPDLLSIKDILLKCI